MHGKIGNITQSDDTALVDQPFVYRYRVQVPAILLVVAALQLALSFALRDGPSSVDFLTVMLTLGANAAGMLTYRQMRHYPGTNRLAKLLPSIALGWASAFALVASFRIPYSALILGLGAIFAFSLTLLFNVWVRRPVPEPYLVIPSMRVNSLLFELEGLPHSVCSDPTILAKSSNSIIADLHADLDPKIENAIVQATLNGRRVFHIKQVLESLTGRVRIDHLSENAFGTLAPNESYAFIKSILERLTALVLLIVTAPVLFVAALAIKCESSGPAIFRQTRTGFRGKPFTVLKLRTMRVSKVAATRESDITRDNDPRITQLGKFLRESRIDELPQLVNVLRGEMSFIGPRPETESLSRWYEEQLDFYAYRHVVLPGITGWAQVRQGHVVSPEDVSRKLQYDFYYIKNFSFWLDILIALETIKVMVLRLGAK